MDIQFFIRCLLLKYRTQKSDYYNRMIDLIERISDYMLSGKEAARAESIEDFIEKIGELV